MCGIFGFDYNVFMYGCGGGDVCYMWFASCNVLSFLYNAGLEASVM